MQLQGKIAIVTGADSGMGQAIAETFAQEGADIAITCHSDRDGAEATARLVRQAGRRAVVIQGDVGDPDWVTTCFATAREALGVPDILVNNAGIGAGGTPADEFDAQKFERIIRTDLMGPFFCCQHFIRARRGAGGGGKIVTISSVHEQIPSPGSSLYGMATAALAGLVRSLALELAPDRINVNNIAPGLIETPMTSGRIADPEERRREFAQIPLNRAGRPREIAGLALYLASPDSDYVTGQTYVIDGGLEMNWGQGA